MTTLISQVNELLAMFADRLREVGGQVQRTPDSVLAAHAIQTIAAGNSVRMIWMSSQVANRAPLLFARLGQMGLATRIPASVAEIRDQPVGLAIGEAAIAETGSVVVSEPHRSSRSVTLMTEELIVVCPTSALLPSLDAAATLLREISASGASYATFITGVSRTADIERQLTVGVQGPGALHVILVDDLS